MSAQHYTFAHRVLPELVFRGDHVFGILSTPENQEFLHDHWNRIPQREDYRAICEGHRQMTATNNSLLKLIPHESPVEYERVIAPAGLRYSAHWIGEAHLVFLITLPAPTAAGEAYFAIITTSPRIEYFTLEKSVYDGGEGRTMFCGWKDEQQHLNFGSGPAPVAELFLKTVCRRLGLPEIIEAPLPVQLKGAQKRIVIDLNGDTPMSAEDEALVARWCAQGAAAEKAQRFEEAEACLRAIFDKRMEIQGPTCSKAFYSLGHLAQILIQQRKYSQAEEVCRLWWLWCRRYRSPGSQELFLATTLLVRALSGGGKGAEALQLLDYRVNFFRQMRGKDSGQYASALSERKIELLV